MSRRLRKVLRNPVVVIVPLVAVALLGWQVYVKVINQPSHASRNLLTRGDFEKVDKLGLPEGWSIDNAQSVDYSLSQTGGFGGGKAFDINIHNPNGGSLDLKSSLVVVEPDTTYFFKGYYKSETPFSLLIRYFNRDGTNSLQLMSTYRESKEWTGHSMVFQTEGQVERAQIVYRLAEKGSLHLDRTYVDKRSQGVRITENADLQTPNLIGNADLSKEENDIPPGWTTFGVGDNTPKFSYMQKDGTRFLRATVSKYKNGEAKWDHTPIPVESGQYTQIAVDYRSDSPARLVAEYALDDRKRTFVTLASLPPAQNWTRVTGYTEAPPRAVEVSMNVVLEGNGTVDTDNYGLRDVTKQGQRHFKEPLVSVVFDEARQDSATTAVRIMDYLGYKGTFYLNPTLMGEAGYMGEQELKQLRQQGHQLASSGSEPVDLTTLNVRQLDRQLRLADDYFAKELGIEAVDFAPPKRLNDAEVQELVRTYYRSSLGPERGINTKQNFDVYNLKTLTIDRDTSEKRIQTALDEAWQNGGWLILVYHRLDDTSKAPDTVTSKAFTKQLELIEKSGTAVKTVEAALDEVWAE